MPTSKKPKHPGNAKKSSRNPAKPAPPPYDPMQELATLPHQDELVILGSRRILKPVPDAHGNLVHPQVVLWVSEQEQVVYAVEVVPLEESADGGVSEAVDILVEGLLTGGQPQSGLAHLFEMPAEAVLPGNIIVTDAELAAGVTQRLGPLGVQVAVQAHHPILAELFEAMLTSLGIDKDGNMPPPFAWDLPLPAVKPLFAAAKRLWQRAPWEYQLDHPAIAITLGEYGPEPSVTTVYASVMGADGQVVGVALYHSLLDFEDTAIQGLALMEQEEAQVQETLATMRQQGLPVDQIPPEVLEGMLAQMMGPFLENSMASLMKDTLLCFFDDEEEADPTYLDWMDSHKLKGPARGIVPTFQRTMQGGATRQPNERETQALTLTLEALSQFFTGVAPTLKANPPVGVPLTFTAKVGTIPVTVTYTPEDDEEADDEE